jgi:predicted transcriptional regulator of viral defense system
MKKLTRYILSRFGGNATTKDEIKEACKRFDANPDNTTNYMISYGYLVRILRGLYYVKTFEEFELRKSPDIYKILFLSLNKLNVKWYFGLYTGLRLNGLTHEFFDTIFVLNDQIYRPKEIKIAGEKVKFLKLSSKLVDFGVVNESDKRFSDVEKTLLDLIYISRYRSVPEGRIISMIGDYGKRVRNDKVLEYLRFYPKAVEKVVKAAGLL